MGNSITLSKIQRSSKMSRVLCSDHEIEYWMFWGLGSACCWCCVMLGSSYTVQLLLFGELVEREVTSTWQLWLKLWFAFLFSFRRLLWRTKPAIQHSRKQSACRITLCKSPQRFSLVRLGSVTFHVLVDDGFTRNEGHGGSCCFSRKHFVQKGELWTAEHSSAGYFSTLLRNF